MGTVEIIFLASSVLTLLTGLVILFINPWRTINRCYVLATGLSAVWLFCIFMAIHLGYAPPPREQPRILFWVRLGNAVAAFLPWAYFLIKDAILLAPATPVLLRRSVPVFIVSCLLAILAFTEFFIPSDSSTELQKRGGGYLLYLAALAILSLLILFDALRRMRSCQGVARIEIKFFAINFCLATLVVLALFFLSTALRIHVLRYAGAVVVVISFSLTLWAVCYHRVFDARQLLLGVGQRVLLLGVLAGATVLFATAAGDLSAPPYGLFFASLLACLLAVWLDRPTRRWLGLDPADTLHQARQTIIGWTRRESDETQLQAHFTRFLAEWCQTDQVAFLFPQAGAYVSPRLTLPEDWSGFDYLGQEGWVTPETLHRRTPTAGTAACLDCLHTHRLGALLAVPRGSPAPSLLVALGRKNSLRPYTYPDIQLLLELAELMDNILTHSRVAARTAKIEKMESAAMMSRGLAHDLNNLATPVSTFLLHMEGRVTPGTAEAEVLADAKQSIRVMQDYIRESLFYARRLVPDFQPVSSTELLASTVGLTQTRAKARGVEVVVGPSAGLAFRADRVLLLRMLQNLVSNGIDATPEGGRVTLAAEPHGLEHIRFTVADEGPGVPAAIVDRIFEPYFTTKDTGNRTRGLGLGLAISLKIGSLHGGTITVGRASSGGAVFTATLPLSPRSLV